MITSEKQISEYLEPFSPEIISPAQALRTHLKETYKPSTELVGDSTISVNIGYGFTQKAWDCFCAIIVYSKHINISFPAGAFLLDPDKILQGTGSKIRHIRVNEFKDIKKPAVAVLLAEARKRAFELAGEPSAQSNEIKTIIKKIAGVKKRPT